MRDRGGTYGVVFSICAWLVTFSVMLILMMPFVIPLHDTWGDPPHFRREVAELSLYYSGGLGVASALGLVAWYWLVVRPDRGGWPSWLVVPSVLLMLASLAQFLRVNDLLIAN